MPGEENRFLYTSRGVAAVIAPWNFPLAILTGMTTAALATGNTVIMKPAEQSSVIAAQLMAMFTKAGIPAGVLESLSPSEVASIKKRADESRTASSDTDDKNDGGADRTDE